LIHRGFNNQTDTTHCIVQRQKKIVNLNPSALPGSGLQADRPDCPADRSSATFCR